MLLLICLTISADNRNRLAFPTMSKSAPAEVSRIVSTIPLSCSKIHNTHCTELLCEFGLEPMKSAPRPFAIFDARLNQIIVMSRMKPTGFRTA